MVTNRTMYLYHVTHKHNWFPVMTLGLQATYSHSLTLTVFLVTESKISWAMAHVCNRHGWDIDDCVVVAVRVRRANLRRVTWRGCTRGVWKHRGDILPCKLEWIDTATRETPAGELPPGVSPYKFECPDCGGDCFYDSQLEDMIFDWQGDPELDSDGYPVWAIWSLHKCAQCGKVHKQFIRYINPPLLIGG